LAYARRWQVEMALRNLKSAHGHPESADLRLGAPSQTAWLAHPSLRVSHGFDGKGVHNGTRLVDRLRLSSHGRASARRGDPLYEAVASLSANCGWPMRVALYAELPCASKPHSGAPPVLAPLCCFPWSGASPHAVFPRKRNTHQRFERKNRFCMLLGSLSSRELSFPSKQSSRKQGADVIIADPLFCSLFSG